MVIEIENLKKSFVDSPVLKGVTINIDKDCVYGLVGLNGAGKTTLIRLILGLLKKDFGQISVLGHNPWDHKPQFYRRMGVVLENDGFHGNMTVRENLKFFASAKNIPYKEALTYFDDYWGDTEIFKTDKKVKYLSRGQRVQCGLCRALMGWPQVCIFDEPAVSLDVTAYEHLKAMITEAKKVKSAIIISSHQLETIDDLCDRVGVLRNGVIEELEQKGDCTQGWAIVCDYDNRYREILQSHGASQIHYTNGFWRFTLNNGVQSIPQLVRELVIAGCNISQVRPTKTEFSDSIKNIYKSGSEK